MKKILCSLAAALFAFSVAAESIHPNKLVDESSDPLVSIPRVECIGAIEVAKVVKPIEEALGYARTFLKRAKEINTGKNNDTVQSCLELKSVLDVQKRISDTYNGFNLSILLEKDQLDFEYPREAMNTLENDCLEQETAFRKNQIDLLNQLINFTKKVEEIEYLETNLDKKLNSYKEKTQAGHREIPISDEVKKTMQESSFYQEFLTKEGDSLIHSAITSLNDLNRKQSEQNSTLNSFSERAAGILSLLVKVEEAKNKKIKEYISQLKNTTSVADDFIRNAAEAMSVASSDLSKSDDSNFPVGDFPELSVAKSAIRDDSTLKNLFTSTFGKYVVEKSSLDIALGKLNATFETMTPGYEAQKTALSAAVERIQDHVDRTKRLLRCMRTIIGESEVDAEESKCDLSSSIHQASVETKTSLDKESRILLEFKRLHGKMADNIKKKESLKKIYTTLFKSMKDAMKKFQKVVKKHNPNLTFE